MTHIKYNHALRSLKRSTEQNASFCSTSMKINRLMLIFYLDEDIVALLSYAYT